MHTLSAIFRKFQACLEVFQQPVGFPTQSAPLTQLSPSDFGSSTLTQTKATLQQLNSQFNSTNTTQPENLVFVT